MINCIKFFWKHYVKQQHEPNTLLHDNEGFCECGRKIYKTNKGDWIEG